MNNNTQRKVGKLYTVISLSALHLKNSTAHRKYKLLIDLRKYRTYVYIYLIQHKRASVVPYSSSPRIIFVQHWTYHRNIKKKIIYESFIYNHNSYNNISNVIKILRIVLLFLSLLLLLSQNLSRYPTLQYCHSL